MIILHSLNTVVEVLFAPWYCKIVHTKNIAPTVLALNELPRSRESQGVRLLRNTRGVEFGREVGNVGELARKREPRTMSMKLSPSTVD